MNEVLFGVVVRGNGVVHRRTALQHVGVRTLDHAVESGGLVRVLPSTYALPELSTDPDTLRRAGLAYAGAGSAVSHLSTLRLYDLPVPPGHPEYVTVPTDRRVRATDPVRFTRSRQLLDPTGRVTMRVGIPTVRLERALVESWPLLAEDAQRAPAILAIQRRLTTPDRIRRVITDLPKLSGRQDFVRLVELLDAGCHSMLEIWGHLDVFTHRSLPPSRGQVALTVGRRTMYLDRWFEAEQVNVELDGRKYHSSPRDRERDLRRDVQVSTRGAVVLRFSHDRIQSEPDIVRAELAQVLAVRRRQLGVA